MTLETSMKGSNFVFDSIDGIFYECHRISRSRSGSYIDSPDWIKNKKVTISPKNNEEKCFQHAVTVAFNHESIVKDLQRISKIKLFINNHNWKEISFQSHVKNWTKFELNNKLIGLNGEI